MAAKKKTSKSASKLRVETLTHDEAKRKNIPTAEYQSIMQKSDQTPVQISYNRRNRDLDPQLVWRSKDNEDWSDLVVSAPPLYIQEKVHPKVLIDDLVKQTERSAPDDGQINLFADFNGLPTEGAKTEFYQHDSHWSNRMVLGDSLQVMASLAEREGLRSKVQCIYFDPPYGIKFNSNFQWSTTSRDVKDGNRDHITREPEQVKAFRDTWRDGIHSYLTYLRDRLAVSRDLLSDTGSIFVQIGDENMHRVRSVLDEVFGEDNFISLIVFRKTTGKASGALDNTCDFILWYAKKRDSLKYRPLFEERSYTEDMNVRFVEEADGKRRSMTKQEADGLVKIPPGSRAYRYNPLTSARPPQENDVREYKYAGKAYSPGKRTFSTNLRGLDRLGKAGRLHGIGNSLTFVRYFNDFAFKPRTDIWDDTRQSGFADEKIYVVQTGQRVVERCVLMASDPGDLVLDPTCGSGTTAVVAEQWGRRWITIDTSRVALALARSRVMGAKYPYYTLADSREGQIKEAELTRTSPSSRPVFGSVRSGFVYERVPHITLKSIANNSELDVIWDKWTENLKPLLKSLNSSLKKDWQEWDVPKIIDEKWPDSAKTAFKSWYESVRKRQAEVDSSIAAKAEYEYLYDRPYVDKKRIRVSGPFTVESISPHRTLIVGENDELIDRSNSEHAEREGADFVSVILETLRTAGVQQAKKEGKLNFTSLAPWPGDFICADGRYLEGLGKAQKEKRAAIFVGPEFGTVSRPDLVAAAREAGDADFDVLIACAFNFDALSSEFDKLGRIPVLKARMNADLHMAEDLKNTGKGNLFVIFGDPDIEIIEEKKSKTLKVKVNGVDVFHPTTGEVHSDGADGIACWFVDTNYNEESFFVRHAYFLGANDPYKSLKSSLKAEITEDAWETLNSDTSRSFEKPKTGRIAIKVINHLGDEVMKVFKVP